MRQGTAVAIFAALVGAALLYTALSSRDSLEDFRREGREMIHLRRAASPRPGLLGVSPTASPTPGSSAKVGGDPDVEPRIGERPPAQYPPDTLCGFFGGSWKGSERDFDRALGEYLVANGPRDDALELFLAMEGRDWETVADAGRTDRSAEAEEIAFLARAGLIDRLNGIDGRSPPPASLDPRDLDAIDEFRRRDPQNSFWPLVEAYLKQKENVPTDRATLIAEAASLPGYRNPIAAFYAKVRGQVLASGDDRAFLAFANLETRVPMLDGNFYRSLSKDVGKEPENDEMIKWIGKTMIGAQFLESGSPGPERFMDAFSGGVLMNAAERGQRLEAEDRRKVYDRFSRQFALGEEQKLLESTVLPGCADDRLSETVARIRKRAAPNQ